jgi:hypothetical protein
LNDLKNKNIEKCNMLCEFMMKTCNMRPVEIDCGIDIPSFKIFYYKMDNFWTDDSESINSKYILLF